MEGSRRFATAIILLFYLHYSPSLGSKTPTAAPRYFRIVQEHTDDFCIGRPQDSVVYCASPESIPRLCADVNVNFTRKLVVLQGPEGECLGMMDGRYNEEASSVIPSRILQDRLPLRYPNLKLCFAFYDNGKWIELGEQNREDVYRIKTPPKTVSSTYVIKREPWVRINLGSVPQYLCVGRNGSEEVFCSSNPRERANCRGSSFVNFDYRHVVMERPMAPCTLGLSGYYDMLVELKTRSELMALPVYDKDQGESCVSYGFIDGAQENPCSSDGRRCRP